LPVHTDHGAVGSHASTDQDLPVIEKIEFAGELILAMNGEHAQSVAPMLVNLNVAFQG
jgi:hypothetical protein